MREIYSSEKRRSLMMMMMMTVSFFHPRFSFVSFFGQILAQRQTSQLGGAKIYL